MKRLRTLLVAALAVLPVGAIADTYLLMAEEPGCMWCARWNKEISEIYPKTPEGQAAPLKRFDLHADVPEATLASRVRFTPTFILVEDGREVGRIEGYPGEDFFWGMLGEMLRRANISLGHSG